jgi:Fe-S-cluster containining protein
MNSIKEIKEQLGYEEIGLDDTFVFHCTQCGKCCIHRDDILLSPKDLFNIAKKFQITPENALEQYCETYIGSNSRFPVVRLKPQGSVKRCPLLKDRKCLVHDVKPREYETFSVK